MREWIPVSTSPKGRLAIAAVQEFGARPYDEVTVGQLATAAGVTTGALYHHFDSKLGLYTFVRRDVEQRLLDRMEGALAAAPSTSDPSAGVVTALLVGFDFAVKERFFTILGDPPAGAEGDRLADLLALGTTPASPTLGRVLAAAWRAALSAVGDGTTPAKARAALEQLTLRPAA